MHPHGAGQVEEVDGLAGAAPGWNKYRINPYLAVNSQRSSMQLLRCMAVQHVVQWGFSHFCPMPTLSLSSLFHVSRRKRGTC